MYRPTTIDDLTDVVDTERDALIAAAILPHLPKGDVMLRVRDEDAPPTKGSDDGVLETFERRVPTIGGSENLRRCALANQDVDDLGEDDYQATFEPVPHGIRSYRLSLYDVDVIAPVENTDAYDFDDTDQTALSDFGVTSSVVEHVHVGIGTPAESPYDRKPLFPV